MATATQADVTATSTWQNLVALNGATASVDLVIQNKGDSAVQVVFGGSQPTDEDGGLYLERYDSVQGNAAAIWLRALDGSEAVGVTLL